MDERIIKRITIGLIFVVILSGVGYGLYSFTHAQATCFDNKQNQDEEGIDCGAVCGNSCSPQIVPLEIISNELVEVDDGYDFVAKIRNPNTFVGGANVSYDIIMKDSEGTDLEPIRGTFYILPVQTKYIIKSPLVVSGVPVSATMVIKDITWHMVNASDLQIDFPLIREQHGAASAPGVKYQVEGTISNISDFDFDRVDVSVLLLDSQGVVRAVTTTVINTFLTRSERYFKVTWPTEVQGEGLVPQVQATTNVFNNSNFIKRYGTQEEFQRYQ